MSQAPSNVIFVCSAVVTAALVGTVPPALAADPEFCVTCSGPQAQYRCTFSGDPNVTPKGGLQLFCITTLAREGGHQSCAVDRQSEGPCNGTPKVLALPDDLTPDGVTEHDGASPQPAPAADATAPHQAPPASAASPAPAPTPATGDANSASPANGAPHEAEANTPPDNKSWSDQSGAPKPPSGQSEDATQAPDDGDDDAAGSTVSEPVEEAGKAVGDAAKSTGKALEKAGSAVGNAAKKTWKCLTTLFGDC